MLLSCQHEDGEYKLGGQEHFDEKALDYTCAPTESGLNVQFTWEHALNQTGRSHTAKELGDEQEATTDPG
jgi:hypothetical protein